MDPQTITQALQKALPFIKNAEGYRLESYRNKRKDGTWEPWTVGYGFTFDENGKSIGSQTHTVRTENKGMRQIGSYQMPRDRADKFIIVQTTKRIQDVLHSIPLIPLTANQLAAITSLHHNIGPGQWNTSTVRRMLLAKKYPEAAKAFLLWKTGNKPGDLLPRREKEVELFLS